MKKLLLLVCISALSASLAFADGKVIGWPAAASATISDDFSTDTSADYSSTNSSVLVVSGGVASTSSTWDNHIFVHDTSTGSNDHYVQVDVEISGADESCAILRSNGTTGYVVCLENSDSLRYYSFNGGTLTLIDHYGWSWTTGVTDDQLYTVKVEVSGSIFHAYIDLNGDGDFLDTDEDLGTDTDSTYSTGVYAGFAFGKGSSNTDVTVDNFEAGL